VRLNRRSREALLALISRPRFGAACCAALLAGIAVELSLAGVAPLAPLAPSFAEARNFSTGDFPVSVATGDLNNDGKQDITTANFGAQTVSVLFNRGGARFRVKRDYPTGRGPYSVVLSDLNGDGSLDLAIANRDADTVSVRLNRGDGRFGGRRDYRMRPSPNWIASDDLTGDDKPDLAVATRNADFVSVFVNNGDGSFAPRRDYRAVGGPLSVAIGDVNSDGALDLATPSQVLLNQGDGTFQPPRTLPGLGGLPGGDVVTIGDLNGDGKPDLAGASCERFFVFVFVNRGDGSFRVPRRYNTLYQEHQDCPAAVAIADLNGDRRPELAFVNGTRANSVSVLTNRGDAAFSAGRDYQTENSPVSLAIGELNGDNKPDLVAANSFQRSVSVLANVTGRCAVPNVERRPLRIARQRIIYAGCSVGTVRRAYSMTIGAGRVISERPEPGKLLHRQAKVNLIVSRGRQR
jgi:hypothetical protein